MQKKHIFYDLVLDEARPPLPHRRVPLPRRLFVRRRPRRRRRRLALESPAAEIGAQLKN